MAEPTGAGSLLAGALLVNCLVSFAGALACVALAVRLGRSPRLAKWVLLLPFVKAATDLVRGPGPDAYVLSEHAGHKWELGQFLVGFGFEAPVVPVFHARLGARFDDRWYPLSAGDLVGRRAVLHLGAGLVTALVSVVVAVSLLLVARRLFAWWRFQRASAVAARAAEHVASARVGRRRVRILCTDVFDVPFTAGLFAPVVWLPRSCRERPPAQHDAVLAHELAHVREHDVLLYGLARLLSDVFWFVPGARWLARRVHHHGELAADALALRAGVSPAALARAILAQAEVGLGRVALGGRRSERRARLDALLASRSRPRWRALAHGAVIVALGCTALASSFAGYL